MNLQKLLQDQMQQVLHLMFLNHRKSLAYPQNQIDLASRPAYKEVYAKPRREFMMNSGEKKQYVSVDLNQKKKIGFEKADLAKKQIMKGLSKQEQMLMKKYNYAYLPGDKQKFELPKIDCMQASRKSNGSVNSANTHVPQSPKKVNEKVTKFSKQQRLKLLKRAKIKFRRCVNCVLFINRLKRVSQAIQKRQKLVLKLSNGLEQIILKMINKYYAQEKIMAGPLQQFGQIIKKTLSKNSYKATEDMVNNMLDISECLKSSSIRKDMLKFLTMVTLCNSPLPDDFFTQFQLLRLDFDDYKFRLSTIRQDQIRMVVGIFLAIKLLCNHIFFQPWNAIILALPNKLDKKITPIIWAYSSYFTTLTLNLYRNIRVNDENTVSYFRRKGVKPMKMAEQNEQFYQRMILDYKKQNQKIMNNLRVWINRITNEVLRNREKFCHSEQDNQY